jgi:hypothetical protein
MFTLTATYTPAVVETQLVCASFMARGDDHDDVALAGRLMR